MPRTRRHAHLTAGFAVMALLALSACNDDGRTLRPARPGQDQSISTTSSLPADGDAAATATSPVPAVGQADTVLATPPVMSVGAPWSDGGPIDARFTCDGEDVSPPLSWSAVPPDAQELAITVTDDDADGFVHWVVTGLAPLDGAIPQGSLPGGAVQAANDFSTAGAPAIGWRGPCPPAGGGPHRYRVTLFALNQQLEASDGESAVDVLAAIRAASVASAMVTGTYER